MMRPDLEARVTMLERARDLHAQACDEDRTELNRSVIAIERVLMGDGTETNPGLTDIRNRLKFSEQQIKDGKDESTWLRRQFYAVILGLLAALALAAAKGVTIP